jgi:hypothetical protein
MTTDGKNLISSLISNQGAMIFIITTLWYAYAVPDINQRIDERYNSNGLGGELSNKFGIKREHLADKLYEGIAWGDSLKLMYRTIYPMLLDNYRTYDVGLKVSKTTGVVSYLHTDGVTYIPSYSADYQRWYFLKNNRTEWCQ